MGFFKNIWGALFGKKEERIRNKNLLKHGGYAITVIALVLVGVVAVNVLVDGILAKRVNLEFDLTPDKKNSISAENIEFLKNEVDTEVEVIVIASSPEEYPDYMNSWAQSYFGVATKTTDYYVQTTRLLEVYEKTNDKIKVRYVDPYGTEVSEIYSKYQESFYYGDIFVTATVTNEKGDEIENRRHFSFLDIYTYEDTEGLAQYGMGYYYVTGSNLESKLTSAIASVVSTDSRTVGFIASKSSAGTFDYYRSLLEANNVVVTDIEDDIISAIPEDVDALVICAPQLDFSGSELEVINEFLNNGGKLGKSLIYFANATYQNLPNLNTFLDEWGITVEPGIVFETADGNYDANSNTIYKSFINSIESGIVNKSEINYFVSGNNIPMYENGKAYGGRETELLLTTDGTSVIMPIGTKSDAKPDTSLPKKALATAILSTDLDVYENEAVTSHVLVFSSTDFIEQDYLTQVDVYKKTALRAVQKTTGMNEISLVFDEKTIENTNGLYIVSNSAAKRVKNIFVIFLPSAMIVLAFVIFIIRRTK